MNANEQPTEPMAASKLVIDFHSPGSAQFTLTGTGVVTPSQMHALAAYLEWKANWDLSMAEQNRLIEAESKAQLLESFKGAMQR